MNRRSRKAFLSFLLAALGFFMVLAGGRILRPSPAGGPAVEKPSGTPGRVAGSRGGFPPAKWLRIVFSRTSLEPSAMLEPDQAAWGRARPVSILLNRAPGVYGNGSGTERKTPGCEARAVEAGDRLLIRIRWDDATRDAAAAAPPGKGEGGDPALLYKERTGHTDAFSDAAAVMVPEKWTGPSFPSLMMGDPANPVLLYYWNASLGAEVMRAEGRATLGPLPGRSPAHRALYRDGKWTLVFDLPKIPEGYPVAFALWDGNGDDRDGLKSFSLWYVLTRAAEETGE